MFSRIIQFLRNILVFREQDPYLFGKVKMPLMIYFMFSYFYRSIAHTSSEIVLYTVLLTMIVYPEMTINGFVKTWLLSGIFMKLVTIIPLYLREKKEYENRLFYDRKN